MKSQRGWTQSIRNSSVFKKQRRTWPARRQTDGPEGDRAGRSALEMAIASSRCPGRRPRGRGFPRAAEGPGLVPQPWPPTESGPPHLPLPHTCPARTPGRSPAPLRPLFLPRRMDTVILGDNVAVQPRRRPGPPGRNEAHGHSTRTLPPATAVQAASGIKSLWRGSEWLRYVRLGLGGRSRHQFTKCLLELVKPFHLLTPEKMLIAAT